MATGPTPIFVRLCCWRACAAYAAPPPGQRAHLSYRHTEVVIEADSPDGGWVVLNDLWHPWWFAEVDGRPAGSCGQRPVPGGRRPARPASVRFIFRPLAGAWAQLRKRQ